MINTVLLTLPRRIFLSLFSFSSGLLLWFIRYLSLIPLMNSNCLVCSIVFLRVRSLAADSSCFLFVSWRRSDASLIHLRGLVQRLQQDIALRVAVTFVCSCLAPRSCKHSVPYSHLTCSLHLAWPTASSSTPLLPSVQPPSPPPPRAASVTFVFPLRTVESCLQCFLILGVERSCIP